MIPAESRNDAYARNHFPTHAQPIHDHIFRRDVTGCPACDKREGRSVPTFIERRTPRPGIYAAITEEQFNSTAYTYAGVPVVGDDEGEYYWAYGHIDPATFAAAVDELHRIDYRLGDEHEPFDPNHHVSHIWAVRTSPGLDEWRISWAREFQNHGERFPLTLLDIDGNP